ncbi:DNA repair protein rhp55 [Neolecta irregularis DAH-3]|uniref:DNA repair protein RAD51 homolog 3 n=1 Tax=Neolecta irregularis (strain DAH-3) TaxID=1198029 RepID=A0A1U7LQ11_NEOID|nr:DNA repair protein rhp55 [Neolecta irregularis DAH-3]|eukprot:OLL24760.1 DNA repair protein rhp55 [Neolecta irregularis DAH-3]
MSWDHRLPTLSASQALENSLTANKLSTGIALLDEKLGGGLAPGHISEFCGPPGSGKTAIALQLTLDSVNSGFRTVWIDTASPLPTSRLVTLFKNDESKLDLINVYHAPTVVSLISLQNGLKKAFSSSSARLVVIDNLSIPFALAFPISTSSFKDVKGKFNIDPHASSRLRITNDLMTSLLSIAAKNNLSVVLLNQMVTKVVAGSAGDNLSSFCTHRVMLYRRQVVDGYGISDGRFACISKTLDGTDHSPIPFVITDTGLGDLVIPPCPPPRKRKRGGATQSEDDDWSTDEDAEISKKYLDD